MTIRFGAVAALLSAALLAVAPCRAAGHAPAREPVLRFLPGERDALPHLLVSLDGQRFPAVLDTGSTGLLVSADRLPGADALPVLGPARLAYSSSGRIMIGVWVRMPVTMTGADGVGVTTRPMPVMLVRQERCSPGARGCTASDRPHGIAMLGIGFAREGDHQKQGTPDRNPLLRVPVAGASGYVLTAAGVQVGLPPGAPEAGGFRTIRLSRNADDTDWNAPPVCIAIDGGEPVCGTILMDTGLSHMFLRLPPGTLPPGTLPSGNALPDGSRVHLRLGGTAAPATPELSYDLVVGDPDSPLAPTGVTVTATGGRAPFVNTGVHFLRCFDVLFDARDGVVGYRRRGGC